MTAATAPRGTDIHRIGTVRIRFPAMAAASDLVITVPPHTAMNTAQSAKYLAERIMPHVLMFLPLEVGPQDYTVTVDLDRLFDDDRPGGTATITEVLRGAARVRRQPTVYGIATITAEEPPPAETPTPRPRRRR